MWYVHLFLRNSRYFFGRLKVYYLFTYFFFFFLSSCSSSLSPVSSLTCYNASLSIVSSFTFFSSLYIWFIISTVYKVSYLFRSLAFFFSLQAPAKYFSLVSCWSSEIRFRVSQVEVYTDTRSHFSLLFFFFASSSSSLTCRCKLIRCAQYALSLAIAPFEGTRICICDARATTIYKCSSFSQRIYFVINVLRGVLLSLYLVLFYCIRPLLRFSLVRSQVHVTPYFIFTSAWEHEQMTGRCKFIGQ